MVADKSIKLVDDISNGFVMIENDRKKCCELGVLFTINQQQDEAALTKMVSHPWLLLWMLHCLTMAFSIF